MLTQGCKATICMPVTTPGIKVDAVRRLGATVEMVGESYTETQSYAQARRDCPSINTNLNTWTHTWVLYCLCIALVDAVAEIRKYVVAELWTMPCCMAEGPPCMIPLRRTFANICHCRTSDWNQR